MNWKRILPVALIAFVILCIVVGVLFGTTGEKKVGITVHDLSDQPAREYAELLYSHLTNEGYTVMVVDAANDQSRQNQQIENWIEEKYDAVIVSPVMVSAVAETLEIARQAKLPVVLIGKEIPDDALAVYDRVSYVGNPAMQWGQLGAEVVLQWQHSGDMNGDGLISYLLMQDDPENTQKKDNTQMLMQKLQDAGVMLKEIRQITTGGNQVESKALCTQSIANFGKDIEIIICDSDGSVLGAKRAIEDSGRAVDRDIYLVSAGDTQQTLQEVAGSKISAVIHRDFPALCEKTAEVLKLLIEKKSPEKVNLIDYVTVTPENAEDYITFKN